MTNALPSASPTPDEPILASRWVVCSGCGHRPEDLHPTDAVASLRQLQRRSTVLLRRPQPNPAPIGDPTPATPWSATESASRIAEVLARADRRLRRLLGEPDPAPPDPTPPTLKIHAPQAAAISTSTAGLASVIAMADRLIRTIAGATTEDWYRRRPGADVSAAELVWLALHEAVHNLEDADLALTRDSTAPEEWGGDGAVGRQPAEASGLEGVVVAICAHVLSTRHRARPATDGIDSRLQHPASVPRPTQPTGR